MEQRTLRDFEHRCIQEEPPFCQAACPIHVDVRGFARLMGEGKFAEARKVLAKTMPLPGVLARICDHPCELRCRRKDAGDAVAIGELERACVRLSPAQKGPMVLPGKGRRIAVLGAGLSSLTLAWDLARKGDKVVVFFAGDRPGGRLPDLPASVLPPEILAEELAALAKLKVESHPGQTLDRELLERLRGEYQAVYVGLDDPGVAAADLGLPRDVAGRFAVDPMTMETGLEKVFAGGQAPAASPSPLGPSDAAKELTEEGGSEAAARPGTRPGTGAAGPSAIAEVADGRRAGLSVDRFLQGASLTSAREREGAFETRLFTSVEGVEPQAGTAVGPEGYSQDEAAAEAARCLQCQCLECVKKCLYLERFKGYPKKYAREIYNNLSVVQGLRLANTFIDSCSQCGLCAEVCPSGFAVADLCAQARTEMVATGRMPASAHEFALQDMAFSNSGKAALFRHEPGKTVSEHVFFPGCQLAGALPGTIGRAYSFLRSKLSGGVGLMLRCCGAPAAWAGRDDLFQADLAALRQLCRDADNPRLVVACSTCLAMFRERAPELPAVSLWEVLEETGLPEETGAIPAAPFALHDPCTTRHAPAVQEAARSVAALAGLRVEELPLSRNLTECCGYGGLMSCANPELARDVAARRAAESPRDYLAYCAMCRESLAATGKRVAHLLDFVFPAPETGPGAPGSQDAAERPVTGYSERQENRARLKETLLHELWGEVSAEAEAFEKIGLVVSPEVRAILEDRRVLDSDVQRVIHYAESTKRRFADPCTGRRLAYHRPRNVTFWVEYSPAETPGAYRIHNAYSHRMVVPGAGPAEAKEGGTS